MSDRIGTDGIAGMMEDRKDMRGYAWLMAGQLLSLFGSHVVMFSFAVWVFTLTGSVVEMALLSVCAILPTVLVSPFAGVIADRLPRKPTMILADSTLAVVSVIVLILSATDLLQPWHLYISALCGGFAAGLQRPLFESLTPLMVQDDKLVRVNGIVQTVAGVSQLLSPALAGAVVLTLGLTSVLVLDLITFVIAMATLLAVRIPESAPQLDTSSGSLKLPAIEWREDLKSGFNYVWQRRGLRALFFFVTARNFTFAVCEVLALPLLLTLTTADKAGLVLSLSGLGIVLGGALTAVTGGFVRKIDSVFLAQGFTAVAMLVAAFTTNLWILGFAVALAFVAFPVEESSSTSIMQSKVPKEVMGRVSSVRQMMTLSAVPLAMLISAPMAEFVFEPWLTGQGGQVHSLAVRWIGSGEGRGMAFMLLVMGFLLAFVTLLARFYKPLVWVEEDLAAESLQHAAQEDADNIVNFSAEIPTKLEEIDTVLPKQKEQQIRKPVLSVKEQVNSPIIMLGDSDSANHVTSSTNRPGKQSTRYSNRTKSSGKRTSPSGNSIMGFVERRPWLLSLGLLLLVLLWMLMPAGSDRGGAQGDTRASRTLQMVQVSDIARQPLTLSLSMTGQTRADATARVSSELDALLADFTVERGAQVEKGDPLATLSTGSLEAALSGVRAERARAQLSYNTVDKLVSQGVSTEQEKATAWATLQAARAREDEIRTEIAKSTIKAPFSGVVVDLLVEKGDFVGVGQPVVLLINVDPLIAEGDVSERDVSSLSVGDVATVTLLGNRKLQGTVSYISPVADEATRTFSVEISLPNSDSSVPVGMTSQIRVELDTVLAHRLSPALLTLNAQGDIEVATVDENDQVALHAVEIVYSEASGVWVNGVPDNQRVITRGQGFVREGDIVNPAPAELSDLESAVSGNAIRP